VTKDEAELAKSKRLFEDGLISRSQVQEHERTLAAAREKVASTRRQITGADEQVAAILVDPAWEHVFDEGGVHVLHRRGAHP